jgi:hypothetical protein
MQQLSGWNRFPKEVVKGSGDGSKCPHQRLTTVACRLLAATQVTIRAASEALLGQCPDQEVTRSHSVSHLRSLSHLYSAARLMLDCTPLLHRGLLLCVPPEHRSTEADCD